MSNNYGEPTKQYFKLQREQYDMLKDIMGSSMVLQENEPDMIDLILSEGAYYKSNIFDLESLRARWVSHIKYIQEKQNKSSVRDSSTTST